MHETTDATVTTEPDPTDLELELWVRSAAAWTYGRRDSLVQAVRDLDAGGAVADATVEVWEGRVPLDRADAEDDREARACRRIERFREWARSEGVVMPALENGTVIGEGRLGPPVAVRTTPLAMLAAYEDGDLAWVVPNGTGDDAVTVPDRVEELATAAADADPDAEADVPQAPADD